MDDHKKTKEQLICELVDLRKQFLQLAEKNPLQAEETLPTTHQELLDIIEYLPDAAFVIDRDKRVIAWNRAIEEMTGVPKKDVMGKGDNVYSLSLYGKSRVSLLDLLFSGDKKMEQQYNYVVRKGNTLYAEAFVPCIYAGQGAIMAIKASPLLNNDGELVGAVETISDITVSKRMEEELREHRDHLEELVKERTNELRIANEQLQCEIVERKQMEQELWMSEARYRAIVEDQTELVSRYLPDTTNTFVNEAYCRYFGLSREELIGTKFMDHVPEEDCELVKEYVASITYDKPIGNMEHRVVSGGEVYWQQWTDRGIFDEQGNLIEIQSVGRDVTQRKQAEELLRNERQRFFSLLESLPAFIYLQAPDYSIRFANRYFRERFGEPGEKTCYHVLGGRKEPCEVCHTFNVFKTNAPEISELVWFDGRTYQIYNYPFADIDGSPLVLVMGIDISEIKLLKQEMARLDRLNLVGEMAASIGHEIRNPLTTVRGFLQLLGKKKECKAYKAFFDLMIEELDRTNSIITEFLSLAKNKIVDKKEKNINVVLKALMPLIKADAAEFDNMVTLQLDKIPDLLLDEKEIRQLILNLVRNGFESMSPGGNLTIRTFTEGNEVVMAVLDQGKEIEADVLRKIGTPFFTTKESGTGLGLAVCHSIASRHNAVIDINTGHNGNTFLVRFQL